MGHGTIKHLTQLANDAFILNAEKKVTFRRDMRLLLTENLKKTLEDVVRREHANTEHDSQGGRITPPSVYASVLERRGFTSSGLTETTQKNLEIK